MHLPCVFLLRMPRVSQMSTIMKNGKHSWPDYAPRILGKICYISAFASILQNFTSGGDLMSLTQKKKRSLNRPNGSTMMTQIASLTQLFLLTKKRTICLVDVKEKKNHEKYGGSIQDFFFLQEGFPRKYGKYWRWAVIIL